ncbi:helix-turn-helix transcriptional regulator [Snuella lapsa]
MLSSTKSKTRVIPINKDFDFAHLWKTLFLDKQDLGLTYRKHHLFHKLNRIHVEFQFVSKNKKRFKTLTKREKEIIRLLARGYNNPEIAKLLFLSRYTVEQHRKNINKKLQFKSFAAMMVFAYAFDLV